MILILILFIVFIICLTTLHQGGRKNKVGEYYLGDVWYEQVEKGNKTIDLKPGKEGEYDNIVGKKIKFYHKKKELFVLCSKVTFYTNINDLIEKEDIVKIAPHKSLEEIKEDLKTYYSPDKLKDGKGINVLHFKLVK